MNPSKATPHVSQDRLPATLLLTCAAMLAFAANSLIARAALASGTSDALSFAAIRFASGAVLLAGLLALRRGPGGFRPMPGNWPSAACLVVYGLGFALAYVRLGAATGALILFASVQAGMIGGGLLRRQIPNGAEALGMGIAFAAFVYLLFPGLQSPDPLASALMISSGVAWAAYSLRGRASLFPLGDTAGNFFRATLLTAPLAVVAAPFGHVTASGLGLGVAAGAITSGLGYVVWYRALRGLAPIQAAGVQLTVPMIAAFGGQMLLAERPSARLLGAGLVILSGTAITIAARRPV